MCGVPLTSCLKFGTEMFGRQKFSSGSSKNANFCLIKVAAMYHGSKQLKSSVDYGDDGFLFPPEVWSHILSFTEDLEPFRLQRVCKFFRIELQKTAKNAWVVKLLQQKG